MFRIVFLISQILLIFSTCNCRTVEWLLKPIADRLPENSRCIERASCRPWLTCNAGICEMCASANVGCIPKQGLKCCFGLTCEPISGPILGNFTHACRPDRNICQTDKHCLSTTAAITNKFSEDDMKCLPSGECGMVCRTTGKECGLYPYFANSAKCCGRCELTKASKERWGYCRDD
jgi:hypothetical protein